MLFKNLLEEIMKNLVCLMALLTITSFSAQASALPHYSKSMTCVEYYFKKQTAWIGRIFQKDEMKEFTVEGSITSVEEKRAIIVGDIVDQIKKSLDQIDSFVVNIPRKLRGDVHECDDADVVIKKGFGKNLNLKSFTCHLE